MQPMQLKQLSQSKDSAMVSDVQVQYVYSQYPGRCPVSGRMLGKSAKDKQRIQKLLKTRQYTVEDLVSVQRAYIEDCDRNQTYAKNYATFLNNIPDIECFEEPITHSRRMVM
jgi:hypothetical protein